jgi:hypothetical protein
MNPCPCGFYGDPVQECTCSNAMVSRYQARTRHAAHLRPAAGPHRPSAAHIEVPRVEATLRVVGKAVGRAAGRAVGGHSPAGKAGTARRKRSGGGVGAAGGALRGHANAGQCGRPLRDRGWAGGGAGLLPAGRRPSYAGIGKSLPSSTCEPLAERAGGDAAVADERPGVSSHPKAGADDGPKSRAWTWRGVRRSRRRIWRRRFSIGREGKPSPDNM